MIKKLSSNLLFVKEALKKIKTQGSVFPSSKFLTEKMLGTIKFRNDLTIAELGAGTGIFTKKILEKMPENGKLLIFEINKSQANHLRVTITDKRAVIIEDDVANLGKHVKELNLENFDYVISGLPLGNFSKQKINAILCEIDRNLKKDGLFIQFQYFLSSWKQINKIFDAKIIGYELRNLPPAFIYQCKKKSNKN